MVLRMCPQTVITRRDQTKDVVAACIGLVRSGASVTQIQKDYRGFRQGSPVVSVNHTAVDFTCRRALRICKSGEPKRHQQNQNGGPCELRLQIYGSLWHVRWYTVSGINVFQSSGLKLRVKREHVCSIK